MADYYKLTIDKTARPMGNNRDWQKYDHEIKEFNTIEDIKKYLADEYFYNKTKYKTYQDNFKDKNNNPIQAGWIYAFKSGPVSYDDCKHYEQHWINVYKIKSEPILIK